MSLWPLFEHHRHEERRNGSVCQVLARWHSEGPDDRDFRVLWRLVEARRRAGKSTFVVNPLFRHEENDEGDTFWSVLFGLVARRQEAGETDWRFLWVL